MQGVNPVLIEVTRSGMVESRHRGAVVVVDSRGRVIAAWGDVGMDQLVFSFPIEGLHHDDCLEILELVGDKVIPEFDKDRKHSTDYYREQAVPKYGPFSKPLPDVEWPSVIPESALKPLR